MNTSIVGKPAVQRPVEAAIRSAEIDLWRSTSGVPTPYLAVRLDLLRDNLERVASIARSHAVALRPHVKTHKCLEIARMQMECGAVGITASKPQEALVFIEAGIPSVTVAYPVVIPQAARGLLESAARKKCWSGSAGTERVALTVAARLLRSRPFFTPYIT